jgi:adenylylsulfate kinase
VIRETHARSVAKAVSWRVFATAVTSGLVFIFTRRLALSLAVGGLEFITKIGLYWAHERMWHKIPFGRQEIEPAVLWFTGLSGSGKSTIADLVAANLRERGHHVERLDGDAVRNIFPNTGFTPADRDAHIRRVGYLASTLARNGVFVVASFVSPYEESRQFVRSLCPSFVEIHVSTPLEECERRDVKGLYARARRGEIKNFTGIDDPYERPLRPEVTIDAREVTAAAAAGIVIATLRRNGSAV